MVSITTTQEDKLFITGEDTIRYHGSANDFPHWGWAVMWLLVAWPVVFLYGMIGLTRKKYLITLNGSDKIHEIKEADFNVIKHMVKGVE